LAYNGITTESAFPAMAANVCPSTADDDLDLKPQAVIAKRQKRATVVREYRIILTIFHNFGAIFAIFTQIRKLSQIIFPFLHHYNN
jgi:hypothetical protein